MTTMTRRKALLSVSPFLLPLLLGVFAFLFAQRVQIVVEATSAVPRSSKHHQHQTEKVGVKDAILRSELGKFVAGLGEFTQDPEEDDEARAFLITSVGKRLQQKRKERLLKLSSRNASPFGKLSSSQAVQSDALNEVASNGYPVIFIPGLMGSQLEVRLHERRDSPDWFCRKSTTEWSRMWMIDTLHMIPELTKCWLQDMLLKWNATTKTMTPAEGVESRANPNYEGAMQLDKKSPTLGPLADILTQYLNYTEGVDMVAQPYDWRVGPETWMQPGQVFDQMKQLIETTVDKRPGQKPIVAYSISMGGPFFSLFLSKHVTQEWKDKYIHAFFSVSGVMAGSVIAPYVALAGTKFDQNTPKYLKKALDTLAQSTSSLPWLFPHESAFKSKPIVQTPSKNYSSSELAGVLQISGNQQQEALYKENVGLFGLKALLPNVTTYCISGYGIPTFGSLEFSSDTDLSSPTNIEMTNGDNCVPVESLQICETFGDYQKEPVFPYRYFNQTHAGLLYNADVLTLFGEVIQGLEH